MTSRAAPTTEPVATVAARLSHRMTIDLDLPRVGLEQADDVLEQHALARAGFSADRDQRPVHPPALRVGRGVDALLDLRDALQEVGTHGGLEALLKNLDAVKSERIREKLMAARDQTTVGAYRQQTIERVFALFPAWKASRAATWPRTACRCARRMQASS